MQRRTRKCTASRAGRGFASGSLPAMVVTVAVHLLVVTQVALAVSGPPQPSNPSSVQRPNVELKHAASSSTGPVVINSASNVNSGGDGTVQQVEILAPPSLSASTEHKEKRETAPPPGTTQQTENIPILSEAISIGDGRGTQALHQSPKRASADADADAYLLNGVATTLHGPSVPSHPQQPPSLNPAAGLLRQPSSSTMDAVVINSTARRAISVSASSTVRLLEQEKAREKEEEKEKEKEKSGLAMPAPTPPPPLLPPTPLMKGQHAVPATSPSSHFLNNPTMPLQSAGPSKPNHAVAHASPAVLSPPPPPSLLLSSTAVSSTATSAANTTLLVRARRTCGGDSDYSTCCNGKCVRTSYIRDGDNDCGDNSDETNPAFQCDGNGGIESGGNNLFHGKSCESYTGGKIERYCSKWGGYSFYKRCKVPVESNWGGRQHCIGGSETNRYTYSDLAWSKGASCGGGSPKGPSCDSPLWGRPTNQHWAGTCCNSCAAGYTGSNCDKLSLMQTCISDWLDALMFDEFPSVYHFLCASGMCDSNTKKCRPKSVDWIVDSHLQYAYIEDIAKWTDAASFCAEEGAQLASIKSQAEQDFVSGSLMGGTGARTWIGASDAGDEDVWVWEDGTSAAKGNAAVFSQWRVSEPNGANSEDCAALYTDFGWYDVGCEEMYRFICQKCAPGYEASNGQCIATTTTVSTTTVTLTTTTTTTASSTTATATSTTTLTTCREGEFIGDDSMSACMQAFFKEPCEAKMTKQGDQACGWLKTPAQYICIGGDDFCISADRFVMSTGQLNVTSCESNSKCSKQKVQDASGFCSSNNPCTPYSGNPGACSAVDGCLYNDNKKCVAAVADLDDSKTSAHACFNCPADTYQKNADHRIAECTAQTTCGKGEFVSEDSKTDARVCVECPGNTYMASSSHRNAVCSAQTTCGEDEYISEDSTTAARTCTACPQNEYQASTAHRKTDCGDTSTTTTGTSTTTSITTTTTKTTTSITTSTTTTSTVTSSTTTTTTASSTTTTITGTSTTTSITTTTTKTTTSITTSTTTTSTVTSSTTTTTTASSTTATITSSTTTTTTITTSTTTTTTASSTTITVTSSTATTTTFTTSTTTSQTSTTTTVSSTTSSTTTTATFTTTTTPLHCIAGEFWSTTSSFTVLDADLQQTMQASGQFCHSCSPGQYQPVQTHRLPACIDQPSCGQGERITLPTTTTKQACLPCQANTFQPLSQHQESTCQAQPTCSTGQFISADSSLTEQACTPCLPFTFQSRQQHREPSCQQATVSTCSNAGTFSSISGMCSCNAVASLRNPDCSCLPSETPRNADCSCNATAGYVGETCGSCAESTHYKLDVIQPANANSDQVHFKCVPKFDACNLGELFNVATEECEPCPINTYADSALEAVDFGRRIMCTPCPDEFQQSPTGSTTFLSCKYKFRSLNSIVAMTRGFCTGTDYDEETQETLHFTSITSASDCKNYADTKGYTFAANPPECEDEIEDAEERCTEEICIDTRAKLRENIEEIFLKTNSGEYLPASVACKLTCKLCDPKWVDNVGSNGRLAPPSGCMLEGAANPSNMSRVRYYDSEALRRFRGSPYLPVCEVFRCNGTFEEVVSDATQGTLPVCDLDQLFDAYYEDLESNTYTTFYIVLGTLLLVLVFAVYSLREECCCRKGSTENVLNCKIVLTEDDDPSCCCLKCTGGVPEKVHRLVWLGIVARLSDMATDWAFLLVNVEGERFIEETADGFWMDPNLYTRIAWIVCIVGTALTPLDMLSKAPSLRREAELDDHSFCFKFGNGERDADGMGLWVCRLGRRAATVTALFVMVFEDIPQLIITMIFAERMTLSKIDPQNVDVATVSLTGLNIFISLISLGFNLYLVVTDFYFWKSEKELVIWYRDHGLNLWKAEKFDLSLEAFKCALDHKLKFVKRSDKMGGEVDRLKQVQRDIRGVKGYPKKRKRMYVHELRRGDQPLRVERGDSTETKEPHQETREYRPISIRTPGSWGNDESHSDHIQHRGNFAIAMPNPNLVQRKSVLIHHEYFEAAGAHDEYVEMGDADANTFAETEFPSVSQRVVEAAAARSNDTVVGLGLQRGLPGALSGNNSATNTLPALNLNDLGLVPSIIHQARKESFGSEGPFNSVVQLDNNSLSFAAAARIANRLSAWHKRAQTSKTLV